MHPLLNPHALVPLLCTVAGAVLAVAISVRDHRHPASRYATRLLVLSALWSACKAGWTLCPDPILALRLARWSGLASMLIGPVALQLMLAFEPRLRARMAQWVPVAFALALACVVLSISTPLLIVDMRATTHGWQPRIGPALPWVYVAIGAIPTAALAMWVRLERSGEMRRRNGPWMGLAVGIPVLTVSLTDVILPFLGVDVPRLGGLWLMAWGGVTWWSVIRSADRRLSPQSFAHEILFALPDGVMLLRLDERIRAANRAMGDLMGIPGSELLGRPVSELISKPEDGTAADPSLPWQLRNDRGERTPVSVTRSLLRDDKSNPIGWVLVVRDLREVVSLRNRLLSSGRLAAIGQLAAGIAHEINNPIAYVRSNLSLLERHWQRLREELQKSHGESTLAPVFTDGDEVIHETFEGVDRVAGIVRDVGGFSHPVATEFDLADVRTLLERAVRMTRPILPGNASIEHEYGAIPLVQCRPHELIQVFLNLLRNAAQAVGDDGTIRIVADSDESGPWVSIEDDGAGIAPDAMERIFDPFFTTKAVGIGTGLGLAISKQIVERQGGEIEVTSTLGSGTHFCVRLNAAPVEAEAGDAA